MYRILFIIIILCFVNVVQGQEVLTIDDANGDLLNTQMPVFVNGISVETSNSDIIPIQWTLRSSPPSSPTAGDTYADDGTNTSDGDPGLRIYGGTSWYDMGGGGGNTHEFSFTIPDGSYDCIIQLQIDDNQDFSSPIVDEVTWDSSTSTAYESGWKIFDGTPGWSDMSNLDGSGEVLSGLRGNRVTYVFSDSAIEDGTEYYCAFRIKEDSDGDGSYDDESWAEWTGDTESW